MRSQSTDKRTNEQTANQLIKQAINQPINQSIKQASQLTSQLLVREDQRTAGQFANELEAKKVNHSKQIEATVGMMANKKAGLDGFAFSDLKQLPPEGF